MFAQDISVTFSLENERISDRDTLSPYLVITYSNSSDSSYYFPSLVYEGYTLPIFSLGFILEKEAPSFSRSQVTDCLHDHNRDSALLSLDFLEYKSGQALNLLCYDKVVKRYINLIEPFLALYYYPYYRTTENPSYYELELFTSEELNNIDYLTSCPAFVFLGAGDVHKQVISMSGIKAAGIVLKVNMSDRYASPKVLTGITKYDTATVPPRVGKYIFYTGYFNSNELIVDFSSQAKSHR